MSIPKIIHYCWFGGNPLPKLAIKCIASWKKYLPDYEIKEWNESNFDVKINQYCAQAYEAKKYAFVSDFARFYILYQYGGVYFDVDVELIKPIDDIIANGPFMGCETDGLPKSNINVNPGLGIADTANSPIYREILEFYSQQHFINPDGSQNLQTVVKFTTDILCANGMKNIYGIQQVGGITIYPAEYFNPLDSATGAIKTTPQTRSIHWYAKTWVSPGNRLISNLARPIHRIFGANSLSWLNKLLRRK